MSLRVCVWGCSIRVQRFETKDPGIGSWQVTTPEAGRFRVTTTSSIRGSSLYKCDYRVIMSMLADRLGFRVFQGCFRVWGLGLP